MSAHRVTEAKPLPLNPSAPKAELIALTRALTLREGKVINRYTDSKYAFLVLHAHAAFWKGGLLNARNSPIKYGAEILRLIQTVQKPKQVAVTHGHSHPRPQAPKGNSRYPGKNRAGQEAKKLPYVYKRNDINPVPDHF